MDQKDVQMYALDLYRFLLLRRLESIREEHVQPTQIGCEPESRFSDVVGKAVLALCHREQSSYWTWFVRDKEYMLKDHTSFLITAGVYAEYFYNTSPSKIDSLLRFSAVLLEMVAFAFGCGNKDYISISPIIWEQIFELYFRDHFSSDLSVLDESAEELANVYDSSECETCENGKIIVNKGWLNAVEQSREIKVLLLGSSPCSGDSDLLQSEDLVPKEPNFDCEPKAALMNGGKSHYKDANGSDSKSDVEIHGSKNDSEPLIVASGEKEQSKNASIENATNGSSRRCIEHRSPLAFTESLEYFPYTCVDTLKECVSGTSTAGRGLAWLESYVRDFTTTSGTRASFEEFLEVDKYVSKAFKTVVDKYPTEFQKFIHLQDEFRRWMKLNYDFTKKADEARVLVYHLTEGSGKRKKGDRRSSDSDTDANSSQQAAAEEIEKDLQTTSHGPQSGKKASEEGKDSVEGKKTPDRGEVKEKGGSTQSLHVPIESSASSAASALGNPPRPIDIPGLERVAGFSLETREVDRYKRRLWQYDYFGSDSSNPRSPIKRTLESFASLKRRKISDDSKNESFKYSAPGGSTQEASGSCQEKDTLLKSLLGSQSGQQTKMPGSESSISEQPLAQPGATSKLLPRSLMPKQGEILGLGAGSSVHSGLLTIAGVGGLSAMAPNIPQGSGHQTPPPVLSTGSPLLTQMLQRRSPEEPAPRLLFNADGLPLNDYHSDSSPSDENNVEETETDSPGDSPDGSPMSSGSPHGSGPSI